MSMETEALRASLSLADENTRRQILYNAPDPQGPGIARVVADYLGDPFPAVCEAAVVTLARAASGAAAAAAASHLYALEPAERGYALETLIQLRTHALPTVMALLGDSDRDVRKYAVEALAGIHAANTLPLLVAALQDCDVTVAAAAAEALEALGLPSAVPALASAVEHGSDWLRVAALKSLGIIGGLKALQAICSVPDTCSAPVLAAAAMAASHASPADTSRAIAFLVGLLAQNKTTLREIVLEALGPLLTKGVSFTPEQGEAIAAAAAPALGSPRPTVRAAAVNCVAMAGAPDAAGLAALRADPSSAVRLAVLRALWGLGQLGLADLADTARNKDEETEIRRLALHLLAEIVPSQPACEGKDGLEAVLAHTAGEVGELALQAAAIAVLIRWNSSEGRRMGLALLNDEEAAYDPATLAEFAACPLGALLPLVLDGLALPEPEARRQVLEALLPIERAKELAQTSAGMNLIALALQDSDRFVRAHAVQLRDRAIPSQSAP